MSISRKPIIYLIICLVLFQFSAAIISAQGPTDAETPIVVEPAGRLDLTFEQLENNSIQLSGHGASQTYQFSLPGNFRISPTDAYLDLVTSQFPSIPGQIPFLEIEHDGDLIFTQPITDGDRTLRTNRIGLPDGGLHLGSNQLGFTLDSGDALEESGATVNVTIDKSSILSFNYQQVPYPTDLGLYPFPFTEQSILNIPTTIVIPDQPTSNDLSSAATIASGLGQDSNGNVVVDVVLASELTPDVQASNHLIVIGSPESNTLLAQLDLPLDIDASVIDSGFGVLEKLASPWNEYRTVLVVSGLDDEGIGKASIALNRRAHFLGMQGPVAIIVELGTLDASVPTERPDSFNLEALGYESSVTYGMAPRTFRYDFTLPLEWQLEAPPFFQLKFSHSEAIDPTMSSIDATLNGLPVGSTMLTSENQNEGELVVALPINRLRSGRNTISVFVSMHLPNTSLADGLRDRRAWTVVDNQSEIFLPFVPSSIRAKLNNFPFPFSLRTGLENTYFVLSDNPDNTDINQMVQLAIQLGRESRNEKLTIPVVYASEVTDEVKQNNHLIILGRPTQNGLLAEVNDQLPHPFIPNTDVLRPLTIDRVVFLADPERNAGLLQMIESPWQNGYSILVVTGTTSEGIRLAAEALVETRRSLNGDLAVVELSRNPRTGEVDNIGTFAVDTTISELSGGIVQSSEEDRTLTSSQEIGLGERWWK